MARKKTVDLENAEPLRDLPSSGIQVNYKHQTIIASDDTSEYALLTGGKICEANIGVVYIKPLSYVVKTITVINDIPDSVSGNVLLAYSYARPHENIINVNAVSRDHMTGGAVDINFAVDDTQSTIKFFIFNTLVGTTPVIGINGQAITPTVLMPNLMYLYEIPADTTEIVIARDD